MTTVSTKRSNLRFLTVLVGTASITDGTVADGDGISSSFVRLLVADALYLNLYSWFHTNINIILDAKLNGVNLLTTT